MNILKNLALLASLLFILFFSGCSSKNEYVSSDEINKFYKDTSNSEIINSKNMHRATLRPYSVFGITYYPFVAKIGDQFDGIASWYGPDFHTKKTSNGEIYNMYALTAAHKTLPMNTMLRVDNLDNGKSVIVRINDRGPFVKGRIIDLSNKAAHAVDMVGKGTAQVKITVLGYNGELENYDAPLDSMPKENPIDTLATGAPIGESIASLDENMIDEKIEERVVEKKVIEKRVEKKPIEEKKVISSIGAYGLQVGAFSKSEGAMKTRDDYQRRYSNYLVEAKKVLLDGRYVFKVIIKGFKSQNQAQTFKEQNSLSSAIVISN